jgi:ketol-acid reductoisomerase
MHQFVSDTAKYGDLTRGPRVVDASTRERMREVLKEIQDGTFAREWQAEAEAGMPNYKAMMAADMAHPIEKVGRELRARMSWLRADKQDAA